MIDVDLDHVRRDRRRIGSIDDARCEQVGMERRRHERLGALPIPEGQRGGPLRQDLVPLRRWSIHLGDRLEQQVVPFEADRGIARPRLVAEPSDRISRFLGEHITGVFRPNAIERAVMQPESHHREQTLQRWPRASTTQRDG